MKRPLKDVFSNALAAESLERPDRVRNNRICSCFFCVIGRVYHKNQMNMIRHNDIMVYRNMFCILNGLNLLRNNFSKI